MNARHYTLADQRAFAALSGDSNPVHVDPVAARRTIFGEPVVHGVHLLLTGLEYGLAGERTGLISLRARFQHSASLDGEVRFECIRDGAARTISVRRGDTSIGKFEAVTGSTRDSVNLPAAAVWAACREREFSGIAAGASGQLPLAMDRDLARRMFPSLSDALPAWQVALILATTRLVGMECPGLHSIFSALELRYATTPGENLEWRVERADDRFSAVRLALSCGDTLGSADTFFRPPPRRQASWEEARRAVSPGEFDGVRALVVGGSRGLGEVAVKLLAAGGATVCATWNQGEDDAARLRDALAAEGFAITITHCDATSGVAPELPWLPTHMLYFATPRIPGGRGQAFSAEAFESLSRCHVSGFAALTESLVARCGGNLRVLYPSTGILDDGSSGFAEYCAAKAAGETVAGDLERRLAGLRIMAPRLPRMSTDQTASLIAVATMDPLAVLPGLLREFAAS